MKQQFIGFADSNKFLEAIDRSKPVNLFVGQKSGRPDRKFGIAVDATILTMSQVSGDEVLYFNDITHRWQSHGGHVFEADENRPHRLALKVMELTKRWLDDNQVQYREALLSMPTNYITLEGKATFLKYRKDGDTFEYVPAE
jgi:hypothetical protein